MKYNSSLTLWLACAASSTQAPAQTNESADQVVQRYFAEQIPPLSSQFAGLKTAAVQYSVSLKEFAASLKALGAEPDRIDVSYQAARSGDTSCLKVVGRLSGSSPLTVIGTTVIFKAAHVDALEKLFKIGAVFERDEKLLDKPDVHSVGEVTHAVSQIAENIASLPVAAALVETYTESMGIGAKTSYQIFSAMNSLNTLELIRAWQVDEMDAHQKYLQQTSARIAKAEEENAPRMKVARGEVDEAMSKYNQGHGSIEAIVEAVNKMKAIAEIPQHDGFWNAGRFSADEPNLQLIDRLIAEKRRGR